MASLDRDPGLLGDPLGSLALKPVYQIFRLPWAPSFLPVNSASYTEGVMTDATTEKDGNRKKPLRAIL